LRGNLHRLDNCSCNSGRKDRRENGTGFLRCRRFGRSDVGFGVAGEFRNLVVFGRFSSRTGTIGPVTAIAKAGKKVTRDGILAAVSTKTGRVMGTGLVTISAQATWTVEAFLVAVTTNAAGKGTATGLIATSIDAHAYALEKVRIIGAFTIQARAGADAWAVLAASATRANWVRSPKLFAASTRANRIFESCLIAAATDTTDKTVATCLIASTL